MALARVPFVGSRLWDGGAILRTLLALHLTHSTWSLNAGVLKKNQGMMTRATGTKEGDEQVCPSEMRSTRLFGWRDQKVDDQAAGLR